MEALMRRLEHLVGLLADSATSRSARGASLSGGTHPGGGPSGLSIWVDSGETRRRVELFVTPVLRHGTPELDIHFFEGTPVEVARAKMDVMTRTP